MSTLISTAISYVNSAPHLGHALELIYADAIARARRSFGEDIYFLTGTDESSLKNVRAAEEAGLPVRGLVDRNATLFRQLADRLAISYDDFIRTTEPRHVRGVEELWGRCARAGDFYRQRYRGLYCVGCEQFYAPDELVDGVCAEHQREPEVVEEDNYFFRLSRYQERIAALIESDTLKIAPAGAKAESLSFVRGGLRDFSASRSVARARGWGISVPGDPSQIIYVWFDALANYLTAQPARWHEASRRIQIVGKGITRFHSVYWPGILFSADHAPPTDLVVHGYLTVDGRKIGKSLGNVVDPRALVDEYGLEALRYWLLRHVRPNGDADFRHEYLLKAHDAELADQLGNLFQRTGRLLELAGGGRIPPPGSDGGTLLEAAHLLPGKVRAEVEVHRTDRALEEIFAVVEAANRFLEEQAPWRDLSRAGPILGAVVAAERAIARQLAPFLPATAAELSRRVNGEDFLPGPPLFPKLLKVSR